MTKTSVTKEPRTWGRRGQEGGQGRWEEREGGGECTKEGEREGGRGEGGREGWTEGGRSGCGRGSGGAWARLEPLGDCLEIMGGGLARGRRSLGLKVGGEEEGYVLEDRVDRELHVREHVVDKSVLAAEVSLWAGSGVRGCQAASSSGGRGTRLPCVTC